nr:unnamed protein product [Callosobruchus analis]
MKNKQKGKEKEDMVRKAKQFDIQPGDKRRVRSFMRKASASYANGGGTKHRQAVPTTGQRGRKRPGENIPGLPPRSCTVVPPPQVRPLLHFNL